ncbi:MAG: tRNA (adenosine(37)-N6)-threonylcarbamoyltransferase complex transferase subunit TsaD [Chloroflexota bacterium]|nr:MAG: tRNA (adenosine(37)-N6)-threonylcarbamoyltransferase complex transferase subunit TsaD [Chloroflexota bacterium]
MADTALPEDFTILAVETSCDETAAAVVRGGRTIISNVVASQMDEHRRYGGIVPEVASRQHILALDPVVRQALAPLPGGWADVHAVAATYGPGLSGALMTGLNAAKSMAWMRDLPFVGVNHIEAHIYANWLHAERPDAERAPEPQFPLVALVVSGGHTLLALLEGHGCYRLLGQTRDDAAGEAFDKAARIMGLGFPGGPAIERAASNAPGGVTLPRAWLRDSYDFSFSGLKTAVLHQVQGRAQREAKVTPKSAERRTQSARQASAAPESSRSAKPEHPDRFIAQLAFAFQESVVDVLVTKTVDAARAFGATEVLLAGGVAANTRLREELARRSPVPVRVPPLSLCTDNAAMIAAAAFYRFADGRQDGWDLDVAPGLRLA